MDGINLMYMEVGRNTNRQLQFYTRKFLHRRFTKIGYMTKWPQFYIGNSQKRWFDRTDKKHNRKSEWVIDNDKLKILWYIRFKRTNLLIVLGYSCSQERNPNVLTYWSCLSVWQQSRRERTDNWEFYKHKTRNQENMELPKGRDCDSCKWKITNSVR